MRHVLTAACFVSLLSGCATPSADLGAFMTKQRYSIVPMTKLRTGHETVDVVLNGVRGRFILDSGASGTVIHLARKDKFGLSGSSEQHPGVGAGGQVAMQHATVTNFELGGHSFPISRVAIMDLSPVVNRLAEAAGAEVDGVVGQDVLTNYAGVIDIANQALYLRTK